MRRLLFVLCAGGGDDPVHHLGDAPPAETATFTLAVRGMTYSGTGMIGTAGCSAMPNCVQIGANPISPGGPAILINRTDSTTPATVACLRGLLLFGGGLGDNYGLDPVHCSVTLTQASASPGTPYVGTFTSKFVCANPGACTPGIESATGSSELVRPTM